MNKMKKMVDNTFYLCTLNEGYADEHDVPALAVFNEKEFKNFKETKRSLQTLLGNGGEGFLEGFQGKTGAQLIKAKIVRVAKVDESFSKFFKKAGLSDLSLCNVFEDEYEEEEYENDSLNVNHDD